MVNLDSRNLPLHVAVIMDGNGRWAKKRRLNRIRGHQKGVDAVRQVVTTSREVGIKWLTLYAFSEENWKRPVQEVDMLMRLLKRFLNAELDKMNEHGIRLRAIGRLQKLPPAVREVLEETIEKTAKNKHMNLTLALSYGGRQELLDALERIIKGVEDGSIAAGDVSEQLVSDRLYTAQMPDPDLLIRTSGEYRISNFMLWQLAYTELYFTPTLWPDFGKQEYLAAIKDFQTRERRYGGTSP